MDTQQSKQELEYITKTRAKDEYYLTEKMLDDIGEPDKKVTNPHYSTVPKMKLYSIHRIEKWVQKHDEWVEKSRVRRKKLSKVQKKRHQRTRKKIKKIAKSWSPEFITPISIDIIEEATEYYNFRYNDFDELTLSGLISFIRHQYTDYEEFLQRLTKYKGKTGNHSMYFILRKKVDEMIIEYLQNSKIGTNIFNHFDNVQEYFEDD